MSIFDNAVDLREVPKSKWRSDYIGDGYRSCCYMTDHERNGMIVLFGYDKVGNPQTFICPHKSHIKYNVKYKTDELDIFDRYVETRYFPSAKKRKAYIDQVKGSVKIIEADRPESEFLHEMFDDVALNNDFTTKPIRVHFLDIETEMGQQFEYPETARQRINAFTIYDTLTEKYYTWCLNHVEIDWETEPLVNMSKDKFEIFDFNDRESVMLEHFLHWFENNYPDVICGWNLQAFDMPYVVRRIENVLGKNAARRLSPVGRYNIRENNLKNERANKQAKILADIDGIFAADDLILYRDKFKVKSPLDGGYSLDNVGEAEELGHKIHYEGSLKDLYTNDFQKFIEYNIRDVDLLRRIEEKCKMIPLARNITSAGLCNFGTIYQSVSYLVGSLEQFSKVKMNKIMTTYIDHSEEREGSYEGAFVFPPVPGVYRGGIGAVDFNSLYPNTIRSINLSPETNIGHLNENWFGYTADESIVLSDVEDFTLNVKNRELLVKIVRMMLKEIAVSNGVDLNDKDALKRIAEEYNIPLSVNSSKIKLTRKQIDRLLVNHCIITRNNDILVRHKIKRGVVAEWSGFFYNYRKSLKKQMAVLKEKIYTKEITDPVELVKTNTNIENLNDMQQSTKIRLNSLYGILACKGSPLYDVDLAQSITRQGRTANRGASRFYREYLKKKYNIPDDYVTTVSGDTDSIIFSSKIRIKM